MLVRSWMVVQKSEAMALSLCVVSVMWGVVRLGGIDSALASQGASMVPLVLCGTLMTALPAIVLVHDMCVRKVTWLLM